MHRSNVGRARPLDWPAYPERNVDGQPANPSPDGPVATRLTLRQAEATGTHSRNPLSYAALKQRAIELQRRWASVGACAALTEEADALTQDVHEAWTRNALTPQQYQTLRRQIEKFWGRGSGESDSERGPRSADRGESLDHRSGEPNPSPRRASSPPATTAAEQSPSDVDELTQALNALNRSCEEIDDFLGSLCEQSTDDEGDRASSWDVQQRSARAAHDRFR